MSKEIKDDIPGIEEDEPILLEKTFKPDDKLKLKDNKDVFKMIKANNILGWCISLIFVIYIFEFWWGDKASGISEISKSVIEILKVLIFTLSGYLFGTNNKD